MISTPQILAAGAITAAAVAIATGSLRWPLPSVLVASLGSLILIVAWRALSNVLHLNSDVIPAISTADAGCLLLGAIAPAIVASTFGVSDRRRWMPAAVGGLVAFVVNVVIL